MFIYFKQLTLLDQDLHGLGYYQRTDAAQEELTLGRKPPAYVVACGCSYVQELAVSFTCR